MMTGKSEGARVLSYINTDSLGRIDWKINVFEFEESNPRLCFLHNLETFEAIETWVTRLTSQIVMKFDEESEDIHDFIHEFIFINPSHKK
jgi:patatin-like phospholipase/acyl hydrolase